jgi:anti-sigma B factor antagonist
MSFAADEVTIVLEGELDLSTAGGLGEFLREVLDRKPVKVAVDLAGLSFLDSTGIHCLVDAAQAASTVGCELVVRRPTRVAQRILQICGVDELLLDGTGGAASSDR